MLVILVHRGTIYAIRTIDEAHNTQLRRGILGKMRCNFCGRNLISEDEEYEDDSKGLNYEILEACSNNFS
jgi:hypothetical protein